MIDVDTRGQAPSATEKPRRSNWSRKQDRSSYLDIDQLCKILGVDIPSDRFDSVYESGMYGICYECAIKEGKTEEEAEEIALQGEADEEAEQWNKYTDAVEFVAVKLFDEHNLNLTEVTTGKGRKKRTRYLVAPKESWFDSACEIKRTINGVGMFEFSSTREFLDSGPWTARQAVLNHLHSISDWPDVYEGTKASSMVERRLR